MSYIPPNVNGQGTMASSAPVVISSDQTAVPVSFTGSTDVATSAKQDLLLTELQLKANLTEEQPVYDEGNNLALTRILEQVTQPLYYDPTTNSIRMIVANTPAVTISSGTVTNQTQIGGIPADPVVPSLLNEVWATSIRSLLI